MVDKETFTLVQFQNVCHIIVGQIEVTDIKILYHTLLMDRLWNDNNATLDKIAQTNLSSRFPILFTNSC